MPADYNVKQKPPMPTPDSRYDTTGKTMPSTPGGTNVSMWNQRFDVASTRAPAVPQIWNTRSDWQPKNSGTQTYRPKGGDGNLDGWNLSTTGMNTKKPF